MCSYLEYLNTSSHKYGNNSFWYVSYHNYSSNFSIKIKNIPYHYRTPNMHDNDYYLLKIYLFLYIYFASFLCVQLKSDFD